MSKTTAPEPCLITNQFSDREVEQAAGRSAEHPFRHSVVGVGESSRDLRQEARHVGGAPLNVSYISSLCSSGESVGEILR